MSIRAYKWSVGILLCAVLFFAWKCFVLFGHEVAAAFIDAQCETTQKTFIEQSSDPEALAFRLEFLMGYYEAKSPALSGSPLAKVIERHYYQTLSNAVVAFRSWSTNDLGNDPRARIKKYGYQGPK